MQYSKSLASSRASLNSTAAPVMHQAAVADLALTTDAVRLHWDSNGEQWQAEFACINKTYTMMPYNQSSIKRVVPVNKDNQTNNPANLLDPEYYTNTGGSFLATNPQLGAKYLQKGINILPEEAIIYFNLGIALHEQKKIDAAIRNYKHALTLPNAPLAPIRQNLSQDLLLSGNFEEGWEHYENRFKPGQNDYFHKLGGKPWAGELIDGKPSTLILVAEQGFGDTIQFIRFALLLQDKGWKVKLFCQPALIGMLKICSSIKNISSQIEEQDFTPGTKWCPLMSLVHRLKTNSNNIPFAAGYLKAPREKIEYWQKKLKKREGHLLIGLHWQGNYEHENTLYSRNRSIPYHHWEKLSALDNIEFISLQKGSAMKDRIKQSRLKYIDGQDLFDESMDFLDTAAVIAQCDLIISADSGIVHLAAAMGKPTWLALRWIPEWRWLLDGNSSHWYETIRLFRQPKPGAWPEVVNEIYNSLAAWENARC